MHIDYATFIADNILYSDIGPTLILFSILAFCIGTS